MSGGSWFSTDWFLLSTWRDFEWLHPLWLYAPLLLFFLWLFRFIRKKAGQWPGSSDRRESVPTHWSVYLRYLPGLFLYISMALICVALARPQRINEWVEQWSEGIDIILVIDISLSMKAEDFPPNRLESAKIVAQDFIQGRLSDKIGLVVFSGEAFSKTPLTQDYDLLLEEIKSIDFEMISSPGTAIGSALAISTNHMRESSAKSQVVILLSDGDNTAGQLDPITAAELTASYGIKIYTIGIGKEGRVPLGRDIFGRRQYVESSLDEEALRRVAEIGEGYFYRAANKETLVKIFKEIDELEKSEIKERRYKQSEDYYSVYVKWALCFFLMSFFLKPWLGNILVD